MKHLFARIATALAIVASSVTMQAESARYVFYFIGDGMGLGHVMSTRAFNRLIPGGTDSLLMATFPVVTTATTYSASSPVTDSAASGTALATGTKTRNSMVGMDPDTLALTSVAMKLQEKGYGIGVLTSNSPDDATPAGFYANVPNRGMYYEIGRQAAESGILFLGGSNLRGVTDRDGNATDLLDHFKRHNVTVAHGLDELATAKTRKVVLLNTIPTLNNTIGYAIDSVAGSLTLPEMTRACLAHLEKQTPEQFFMMVESGNIDHAAHGNDAGTVIAEIRAFQDAIKVAYDFYLAHPEETLIVITADHDTGGMSLGNSTLSYDAHPERLAAQRMSMDAFSDAVKAMLNDRRVYTWDFMKEFLADNMGLWTVTPVSEEQEAILQERFDDTFSRRNSADRETLYKSYDAFAAAVFDLLSAQAGIGWTTTYHTGNVVPVFAIGVGADEFKNGTDNAAIPMTILEIVNTRHDAPVKRR